MPTALTVAAEGKVKVPPLSNLLAVPEPGVGVDPSVVYQIPVLPLGSGVVEPNPASVSLTVRGNDCVPLMGEIVGAALVAVEQVLDFTVPVVVGAVRSGNSWVI